MSIPLSVQDYNFINDITKFVESDPNLKSLPQQFRSIAIEAIFENERFSVPNSGGVETRSMKKAKRELETIDME